MNRKATSTVCENTVLITRGNDFVSHVLEFLEKLWHSFFPTRILNLLEYDVGRLVLKNASE